MSRYEEPTLLQVGAIEHVVLGVDDHPILRDNVGSEPTSPPQLSVLDLD